MKASLYDIFQASLTLPTRFAVAVSGGADSMALLLLCDRYAKEHGLEYVALTVDHGLRPEAAVEAQQVAKALADKHIPHHILKGKITTPEANIQAQARQLRYQLMAEFCKNHDIDTLCVGHHQDDQAETVLLRLLRGSGVDGLSAMASRQQLYDMRILRPLLEVPKHALCDFLRHQNIAWIEDPSNENVAYDRVKIRQWLADFPEAELLKQRASLAAKQLSRARDYLEQQTQHAWDRCVTSEGEGLLLDLASFNALHNEMRYRLMSQALSYVGGHVYRPRFSSLERLCHALLCADFSTMTLSRCVIKKLKDDRLRIFSETKVENSF